MRIIKVLRLQKCGRGFLYPCLKFKRLRKIKIDDNTYECPACNYRWSKTMGMADLSFDEDEHCPCCPDCGELIEDGDDYE